MVRLEELQNWHIEELQPRSVYSSEMINLKSLVGDDKVFASAIVRDEVVLAIVGAHIQWEGVAHGWAVISDSIKSCPIEFHKAMKKLIDTSFRAITLHRLEATVRADFDMGQKWLKSLGFEYEATLKYYGIDRTDYKLFARYR